MRRERRHLLAWLLAVSLASGAVAVAQVLPGALQQHVSSLTSAQRDQLYRRAAALRAMDAPQRQQFEQRLAQWQALGEAERRERRDRWQAWQGLSGAERAQLQVAATAFATLPVQQQLDLRARYAQLDDGQRRGWLLGPSIGAHWERLQPLLMHVPVDQRAPLLAALRAMTPQQCADLGVLAQRTPPQSRDRLRRDLLAVPAGNRGAWLAAQLDR